MGSQMAHNLFSKHHVLASDASFVVCDAVPETAYSFANNFKKLYPTARITIVDTPEKYVNASTPDR